MQTAVAYFLRVAISEADIYLRGLFAVLAGVLYRDDAYRVDKVIASILLRIS